MSVALFCHESTPETAYAFLEKHNATLEGDQDKWKASFCFEENSTIDFNYDRKWCSPPNWPLQLSGMANFVGSIPMDETNRAAVLRLIPNFQYCVGIVPDPQIDSMEDPRLKLIGDLAVLLNGMLFTPGSLLDARFRVIATPEGEFDEDAQVPSVS
ncbi:MAG TPA: hypothetical protein P5081_03895 [Phycisphaerae bacterium]|nr:hypothetical protein [Phycisphaerae bacterium]HRW52002.1 hypothetical protein [Phycisphaerae bacterium]